MKKMNDKVVKRLICGTFLLIIVPTAKAAGIADLEQSFREISQTIKAHLPSPQAASQPTGDPCSNADSDARKRLCQEGQENPKVIYHLVLERNIGLRCEDADHNRGYNPIDLNDIPEEFFIGKGECADLAGADLREYSLSGFNFRGANMVKARLVGVNFRDSDFYGANLNGADLRGADLRGANLSEADLRGALFNMETKFPWVEGQAKEHEMICEGDPDWCMDQ